MDEGLRSSDFYKEGRVELDLNVEPVEEAEDTVITTDHDSQQRCDVHSLGNKAEERECVAGGDGCQVNAGADHGAGLAATLCAEEPEVMQCDIDADASAFRDGAASEGNLDDGGLPMVSVKEGTITLQETEVLRCIKSEDDGKDVGIVNAEGSNLHGDSNEAGHVVQKKRRGRKRKNIENSQRPNDEVKRKKDNHLPSPGSTGNVGRVLRSRVIGISQAGPQLSGENLGVAALEVKKETQQPEVDQSEKPFMAKNTEISPPNGRGRKKVKGRRGRPPKIPKNDVLAPPISKDLKKVKRRRGRPPKMPSKDGASEIIVSQKDRVIESKESVRHKKAGKVIKRSKVSKSQLESAELQLVNDENVEDKKSLKSKEGDKGRRIQQQAVRDQIVDILKKAGWTVEYRPRQSKEYSDAVYVDCEGKTHWSCTLAYRKLKEKVENGDADDKTLSAFTVIPEEVLGTLFRTRQKKIKKFKKQGGSKSDKKKNIKEPSLYSDKVIRRQKCKEKINANPKFKKFLRKKTKANAHSRDDDLSMKASNRGRSRSKKDGRNRKRYALLARRSGEMSDQDGDGFALYDGKRSLLSWMIDFGTIQSNAQVQYMNARRTKVMLEGKITGDGICCGCCDQTFTLLDFESHAGSTLCQPLQHICLASGRSLLQCLADSWSKQEKSENIDFHPVDVDANDPNDDTCNICGDGGDLICCDGCPSTFHQSCLNIQNLPSGNWRCVYCSCKFCGTVAGKSCHVDDHMIVPELSMCHLCEERFHVACNQGENNLDSKDMSFCGKGCEKLFEGLQVLLGVKHDLDEGFSWTILQRRVVAQDVIGSDNSLKIECNSKLAVAFSVMDECFMPIVDERSKINMIQNVVYNCGSNFRRLNYCGFYTVILEKGDELVAAASIRLHGNQLAEMPFIGTRYKYRRQGMCRRLIGAVETALCSLGVEQLVIPAIPELIETWTKIFGFSPLEESKRREMTGMSMIVFPGTDMLQKPLLKHQDTNDHITSTEAASSKVDLNKNVVTVEPAESCVNSSRGFLQDASDMKTGFESFIPKEALRVQ
nr:increased DNA methylation 1-like isoform X1 [Ipomoea batatas]